VEAVFRGHTTMALPPTGGPCAALHSLRVVNGTRLHVSWALCATRRNPPNARRQGWAAICDRLAARTCLSSVVLSICSARRPSSSIPRTG
jgi:hypothetical protein